MIITVQSKLHICKFSNCPVISIVGCNVECIFYTALLGMLPTVSNDQTSVQSVRWPYQPYSPYFTIFTDQFHHFLGSSRTGRSRSMSRSSDCRNPLNFYRLGPLAWAGSLVVSPCLFVFLCVIKGLFVDNGQSIKFIVFLYKLDGVGPVDNRPSTD